MRRTPPDHRAAGSSSPGVPPTAERLRSLEQAFGRRFPPSYRRLLESDPDRIARALPRARFVAHPDESARVRRLTGNTRFLPFLVDPQPTHDDGYGFDTSTAEPEYAVVVFAVHTLVARWSGFGEWLRELEQPPG